MLGAGGEVGESFRFGFPEKLCGLGGCVLGAAVGDVLGICVGAMPGFPMLDDWKELGGGVVGLTNVPGSDDIEGGQLLVPVV